MNPSRLELIATVMVATIITVYIILSSSWQEPSESVAPGASPDGDDAFYCTVVVARMPSDQPDFGHEPHLLGPDSVFAYRAACFCYQARRED